MNGQIFSSNHSNSSWKFEVVMCMDTNQNEMQHEYLKANLVVYLFYLEQNQKYASWGTGNIVHISDK